MEIKLDTRYLLRNGNIGLITKRQEVPVPCWRGEVYSNSVQLKDQKIHNTAWGEDGKDYSGHEPWDIIRPLESPASSEGGKGNV